jgi:hypothetical protein
MKWNPILNAAAAVTYITLVALFMRFIEALRHDTPDTLIDGMAAMSLFVFSAAIMAFLFFYQPVKLLTEKKPTESVAYFLKTIGTFGLTMVILLVLASLQ